MAGTAILTTDGIDSLLTVQDAAAICGVSVKTVYHWKNKNGLAPSGLDQRGRPLFKLLDVAKIEQKFRRHAGRQ